MKLAQLCGLRKFAAMRDELEGTAAASHRYFIVNKPYNMVSQFESPDQVRLLSDLHFEFPPGTHAIGRLDNHSEGMLILTTNKKVTRLLFQGEVAHTRTYLVQVHGRVEERTLETLAAGVDIRIRGGAMYRTAPCTVHALSDPGYSFEPPELSFPFPPYTWLSITLTEGKYHQVRKMVAKVHHKCQRLIRVSIEHLHLGDLPPGGVREIEEARFFDQLCIANWKEG